VEETTNKKLTLKSIGLAYKVAGFYIINLMLVYFFEYTCTTCWADRASLHFEGSKKFIQKNVK
jgi:hypothetical protein